MSKDTDYEYYTSKGVSDKESNRFNRYRLHYDRPDPLCEDVSRLTITNNKQESFDVELVLEKNIGAGGNKKAYKMNSRFTPAVP